MHTHVRAASASGIRPVHLASARASSQGIKPRLAPAARRVGAQYSAQLAQKVTSGGSQLQRQSLRVHASSSELQAATTDDSGADNKTEAGEEMNSTVSTSDIWELDFCSRPILDERKKKVWELLICDPDRNFTYSEYFPNNKINSVQLRNALQRLLDQEGVEAPLKVRFFRAQMQTIISKACADLPFKAVPSRRCITLMNWLEERHQTVYPKHPGFDPNAPPLMTYEVGAPQELPDALRGEQWAFVMLPLSQVQQEARETVGSGGFGEVLSGEMTGMSGNPEENFVPGVAVFSQRALPLAAWTNGLELAGLKTDTEMGYLVLETGVNTQYRYASYRRTVAANKEAQEWEEAKNDAGGLHFLAIQSDPDSPTCAGFWMLRDYKPSTAI